MVLLTFCLEVSSRIETFMGSLSDSMSNQWSPGSG